MSKVFYISNAIYWILLSSYLTLKEYSKIGGRLAIFQLLIFFVLGFCLTTGYAYFYKNRKSSTYTVSALFPHALLGVTLIALMVMFYDFWMDRIHYHLGFETDPAYSWILFSYFLDGFIIGLPWFLFFHCYQYGRYVADLDKTRALQQAELSKAQVESLTQKLNPHFLFNTLNTIRWLILNDPDRARRAVEDLAQIMRYSANTSAQTLVPLYDELAIVEQYLSIEKVRFEDLEYKVSCPKELNDVKIPMFSIINLVENAITHGVSQVVYKKRLQILVDQIGTNVEIRILNNAKAEKISKGFGLKSIEKLLEQNFGKAASLSVEVLSDEVVSTIKLPSNGL